MKFLRSYLLALFVLPFLAGCGGVEDEAEDPNRDAVGIGGILHFQADVDKPLSQGANDLLISIHEASTQMPFTAALIDVSAIMPAMAHDDPHAATIEELDGGSYLARGLSLPMAGRWYVDIKASRGEMSDTVRFTYDIR